MPNEMIGYLSVSFALLINFGGLVWGASKMSTTLRLLIKEVDQLRTTIGEIQDTQSRIVTRVAVLEERTG